MSWSGSSTDLDAMSSFSTTISLRRSSAIWKLRMQRRVVDSTSLILDIFAQRARSHEGKLQVELAQLQHLATRLKHGWTHLERQKGGIGLRGPGETQLETDRRLIGNRVKVLRDKLERVRAPNAACSGVHGAARVGVVSLLSGTPTPANRLYSTR
jgi:GTPase